MNRLDIKVATKEELDLILKLQKLSYQSEAKLYNDYNIEPLTQSRDDLINSFDDEVIYLTGYLNGKLIASVRGYIKKNTGFINKLIVHPDFQRRGYGKLMMNSIENILKTASRFELFTGNKSEKNIRLYEKLGYEIYRSEKVSEALTLVFLQKQYNNEHS